MKFNFLEDKEEVKEAEVVPADHNHQWELVAKTIIEPRYNTTVHDNQELTKLAMTGMTTYLFQCVKCPEFKKEEMSGVETSALDRLLDKVEVGGPEYILRDGKTYVLLKQPEQPQTLPVR